MKIICKCGKESKEFERTYTVKEDTENSGFNFVMHQDGSSNYYCDECFNKMIKLAKELIEISGNEFVYAGWFYNR